MNKILNKLAISVAFLTLLPAVGFAETAPKAVTSAVKAFIKSQNVATLPNFQHALVDLNSDGVNDAVVLLESQDWCGSGGCTLLILQGHKAGLKLISSSTVTGTPIRVSANKTKGWKDLLVYSKGKGDVLMRFDGKQYPANPSLQPLAPPAQVKAVKVLLK